MTMILFSAGIERAGRSSRLPDRSGSLDASMQLKKYRWIRSIFWISVLDNVTINQLRAFVAVCDQGSLWVAARKTGRAQSATSHAVKALENALNVELLERNTRKEQLSAGGSSLLPNGRECIQDAEEMKNGRGG